MISLWCVLDSRLKETQTQYLNIVYQANKIPDTIKNLYCV